MSLEQRTRRFFRKEETFNRVEALFLVYAGLGLGLVASAISLTLGLAILVFGGLGFWFLRSEISLRGNWHEAKPLTTAQVKKIAKDNPTHIEEGNDDPEEAPLKHSEKEFSRID